MNKHKRGNMIIYASPSTFLLIFFFFSYNCSKMLIYSFRTVRINKYFSVVRASITTTTITSPHCVVGVGWKI